jgi:hypothetical protein
MVFKCSPGFITFAFRCDCFRAWCLNLLSTVVLILLSRSYHLRIRRTLITKVCNWKTKTPRITHTPIFRRLSNRHRDFLAINPMKKHIFWIGIVLELKHRQIWVANVLGRSVGEAAKKIGSGFIKCR